MPYIGKQPANVPVTADDIPNDSITSAKILDNVITISDIGPNAVGNSEMADDAIGLNELSATGTTNSSTFLRGDNTWATAGSTSASDLTSGTLPIARIADDAVTAAKLANSINTDIATGVTGNTTANAALPKAGGAMTGAITTNSTFDGVDIATRDGVLTSTTATAAAALPKAGGTMTGNVLHNDNVKALFGTGSDLQIYHDGSNSYIRDAGDGDIHIRSDAGFRVQNANGTENYIYAAADGLVRLYHNNATKLDTTATGIDITGNIVVSGTVDGVDIQTLNTTANAALPKAGGTMTGALISTASDYQIKIAQGSNQPWFLRGTSDGQFRLHLNGTGDKLTATSAGVTITGTPNSTVMPTLGGVAIAAKGSNSNGKYTKFADGTMICEVTKTTTEQNNGATAGGFYHSDNYTWTYPVAFHSVPRVVANQRGGHNNAIAAKTTSESTSAATFLTLSVNSTGNSQEISLLAYGWWTA